MASANNQKQYTKLKKKKPLIVTGIKTLQGKQVRVKTRQTTTDERPTSNNTSAIIYTGFNIILFI
jgi:hypothetical protein